MSLIKVIQILNNLVEVEYNPADILEDKVSKTQLDLGTKFIRIEDNLAWMIHRDKLVYGGKTSEDVKIMLRTIEKEISRRYK